MTNRRPTLCVVAGPNGSGKTTTTIQLLNNEWAADSMYINPDNIAQEMFGDWNSPEAVLKAAEKATQMRYECIEEGRDFVFETVFSSPEKLEFLKKAKEASFFIRFFYVCTSDPAINVARITHYDVPSDEGASVNVPERSEKKESSFQNYWKRMFASEDKSQNPSTGLWRTIMRRELSSYFTSPIAYIVAALFLVFSGFLFFSTFFLAKRAELRDFFQSLPMLFSFFIPALTMRLFSEEKKSGSLETLMTLPVTELDVVLGKYLAALISSLFMLVPTVSYVIACNIFGHPDAGPIWGGYIGAVFLAAAFSAIGLFSSSVTKNQILAFFVALAICMFLTFVSSFVVLLPPFIANLFTFISASSHFDSISRGILDSRDLVYFVSVTVFFVALTVRCLNKSRKG